MSSSDPRNIVNGWEIPTESYSDQPYIVKADDGAWVCILTTGAGHEGAAGQHVVTLRSTDCARTWEPPVAVEPSDGPEASYAVLLKAPSGRIYAFYNHNTDNIRKVIGENPPYQDGFCRRVDSLGYFVFKYSDDHGRSWSEQRYNVPLREMDIDRQNPYGGDIRFFWNVGKPFIHDGQAYISVHKVGGFGPGFFTRSEGVLARSPNLCTESDPGKIIWDATLPDGEFGLRTPPGGGPIAEEQSYSVLSDGSFYCVYRSVDGHPVDCYSRDGGCTWSEPQYKRYSDGTPMRHPRAANFAWKCENGKFLYWFHNHGGQGYEDRNPVWLSGGVEVDGPEGRVIAWSQPEIVLYDDDPFVRMSYPDLVEQDGAYYLTETQKDLARVHLVDTALLEGLWGQAENATLTDEGLVLDSDACEDTAALSLPKLPVFCTRDASRADYGTRFMAAGVTLEMMLTVDEFRAGDVVLDARHANGQGFAVVVTPRQTLELIMNDGRTENRWDCDQGVLAPGVKHHVTVIVDASPRVVSFVVDGRFCDGGPTRQFGWGRFSPHLRGLDGSGTMRVAPDFSGSVHRVRLYGRPLRVSEAIGNSRALRAK